jgi:hypothetical protein
MRYDEKGDIGFFRHSGYHSHICPHVTKLDSESKRKFHDLILMAPQANPEQLVTGKF